MRLRGEVNAIMRLFCTCTLVDIWRNICHIICKLISMNLGRKMQSPSQCIFDGSSDPKPGLHLHFSLLFSSHMENVPCISHKHSESTLTTAKWKKYIIACWLRFAKQRQIEQKPPEIHAASINMQESPKTGDAKNLNSTQWVSFSFLKIYPGLGVPGR